MTATVDFDALQLRRVLARFFTGVTVVTTVDETGAPWGVTANSFSSVSLDPPLILWSQAIASPSHTVYRKAERFVINILAKDQVDVSQRFARSGRDTFEEVSMSEGMGGIPLIEDCCATLECRKIATHDEGDHAIFIGRVERLSCSDLSPLMFGDGKYMGAQTLAPAG